jgi:hypothetical protein
MDRLTAHCGKAPTGYGGRRRFRHRADPGIPSRFGTQQPEDPVSRIIEEIDVAVPTRFAYDQWTQFESFPRFMAGVDRVVQVDARTLEWTATITGVV